MSYQVKSFEHLFGLDGFSKQLLANHFTLYEWYVTNINKLNDLLMVLEKEGKFSSAEYAELNRRFGWEFNGMRLHEYYFENLTKEPKSANEYPEVLTAVNQEWDSWENLEKDFKSMGTMRGIGWVVLYYDKIGERLFNVWINEHDTGHLAGAAPLLVMDVFEHAYITDYGLKRADYVEAFFKAIDWSVVNERLESAQ